MANSSDLFLAILALDSYNRGYDSGIIVPGSVQNEIGGAHVLTFPQSVSSDWVSAGFYAVAYEWGGAVSRMRTRLHWMDDVLECLRSAGERLPLGQGGRAANFEGLAIDEVALLGKVIVDGGVDGCELLQRFHLPKSEHRPLSSPER